VTPDEYAPTDADFPALVAYAGKNTRLLPGEIIAAPGGRRQELVKAGDIAEVSLPPFGTLRNPVA
jgi:2-keto-4-pentenoate hydratase/2-oxohepta-3-ene-1,7-dioic acid hydratase in catechol pathway